MVKMMQTVRKLIPIDNKEILDLLVDFLLFKQPLTLRKKTISKLNDYFNQTYTQLTGNTENVPVVFYDEDLDAHSFTTTMSGKEILTQQEHDGNISLMVEVEYRPTVHKTITRDNKDLVYKLINIILSTVAYLPEEVEVNKTIRDTFKEKKADAKTQIKPTWMQYDDYEQKKADAKMTATTLYQDAFKKFNAHKHKDAPYAQPVEEARRVPRQNGLTKEQVKIADDFIMLAIQLIAKYGLNYDAIKARLKVPVINGKPVFIIKFNPDNLEKIPNIDIINPLRETNLISIAKYSSAGGYISLDIRYNSIYYSRNVNIRDILDSNVAEAVYHDLYIKSIAGALLAEKSRNHHSEPLMDPVSDAKTYSYLRTAATAYNYKKDDEASIAYVEYLIEQNEAAFKNGEISEDTYLMNKQRYEYDLEYYKGRINRHDVNARGQDFQKHYLEQYKKRHASRHTGAPYNNRKLEE